MLWVTASAAVNDVARLYQEVDSALVKAVDFHLF